MSIPKIGLFRQLQICVIARHSDIKRTILFVIHLLVAVILVKYFWLQIIEISLRSVVDNDGGGAFLVRDKLELNVPGIRFWQGSKLIVIEFEFSNDSTIPICQ